MSDQAGERLARSACPNCDGPVKSIYGGPSCYAMCEPCGLAFGSDEAYQHGLKLEEERDEEA